MMDQVRETVMSKDFDAPTPFDFELPAVLQKNQPTEERGLSRDAVRLMVSYKHDHHIEHTIFSHMADYLQGGDVLVINTSGTRNSAATAYRADGSLLQIHFSTKQSDRQWIAEIRKAEGTISRRFYAVQAGEVLRLLHGGNIRIVAPYYPADASASKAHLRLWRVESATEHNLEDYLAQHGFPIRYTGLAEPYPAAYYQTVFATETGSAEMPSAGRAFTAEIITRLVAKGVQVVPMLLHTGVSSLETDEQPYEEYYRVPEVTAYTLNVARKQGRRIIGVGTTVIRALETTTDRQGYTRSGAGWTNEFITPQRGIYSVDGLLTGFHEPKASHLLMLEALAGKEHLTMTYREALARQYQWHEFGDLHLILP